LRYPRVWFGLGWAMVVGVIAGSLVPGGVAIVSDIDDKIVHFSSYFLLMIWFAGLYRQHRHYLGIATILVALGAILDILQGGVARRQFDVFDIAANSMGVLLGLGLAMFVVGGWCMRVERWMLK
jgi:VanZ family protein